MDSQWFEHLKDHAGAIHVHTVKSDGAGTLAEVVSAAERAGLSFVILTDHDTRGYADEGAEGWHGNILVVAGEEVSVGTTRYLVIGHGGKLGERDDLLRGLQEARERGGITIALPPEDNTAQLPVPGENDASSQTTESQDSSLPRVAPAAPLAPVAPKNGDWPLQWVDGWEFWCGLEDWARGRLDRKPMTNPFERVEHVGLRGPRRGAIRAWDQLARQGHVLGFAGLNAHGRTWSSTSPGAALPYETLFRSLTTQVLAPELPLDSPESARALLLKALREGHFHTAHSCIASPLEFRFVAQIPGRPPLLEGDSTTYHPQALLHVRLPQSAEIRLVYNGSHLLTAEGNTLEFPVVAPGAYRVEAWNDRRPWVFSNPIWFTPASPEELRAFRDQARRDMARITDSVCEDLLDMAT